MVEEFFKTENQIVNITLLAIVLLLLMSIAIILFFYYSRRRVVKVQLDKANLEISYQKEILQSIIMTQEEERKRISQDLHDAISSKLNVVSLNANLLTEKGITKEEVKNIGDSILNVTTIALESSRKIAHDLLPPTFQKFGFKAAVEELYEELLYSRKFEINYQMNYLENFLKSNEELHLFRIIQELISNSIKHAEAKSLSFDLETKENMLSLRYNDNGKGFDIKNLQRASGLGIIGIENRVAILNGNLNIDSNLGKGVTVTIEINEIKN